MHKVRLAILLTFFLAACVKLAPQSAVGLYGSKPAQQIRGSQAQALESRIVDFSQNQVFAAARAAIQKEGYQLDEFDDQQAMIAASNHHQCAGSYQLATTLAVYITAVDTFPTTQFVVQVDLQDAGCDQSSEVQLAQQLTLEIERLLTNP